MCNEEIIDLLFEEIISNFFFLQIIVGSLLRQKKSCQLIENSQIGKMDLICTWKILDETSYSKNFNFIEELIEIEKNNLFSIQTLSFSVFHLSFNFSKSFSKPEVLTPPAAVWINPWPCLLTSYTDWDNGSIITLLKLANSSFCDLIASTSEPTGFSRRSSSLAYLKRTDNRIRFM